MNQKLQETTKSLESYNVHRKSLEDQLLTQTVKESLKIQKENILEAYRVQKEELKRNLREKQLREEALKKYQQDQIEMKREKAQRFKKEQEIREKAVLDELRGLKRSEKERLKNRTGVLRQIVQNDGKDTYFRMKDLERELERIRSGRVHLTNDVRSIF